jgi:hypothetical protein
VIVHPKVLPIFFANDTASVTASLATFEAELGTSAYWSTVVSEYGVGTASSESPFTSSTSETGAVADSDVQSFIQDAVTSGTLPPPDGSLVYVMHYPTAVAGGYVDCMNLLGYHSNFVLPNGLDAFYIVLPRCVSPDGSFQNDPEGILTTTDTFTHELAEISTDPDGDTWAQVDTLHSFWSTPAGGGTEIGDMCSWDTGVTPGCDITLPNEFPGFAVQRIWSNAAAQAGRDPCQPEVAGEVFVSAPPELPDTVMVGDGYGNLIPIAAVSVPVGQSATVTLDLYSEAATPGGFDVSVTGLYGWYGPGSGTDPFTLTQSATSGSNGDQILVTITRQSAAVEGQCTEQGASTTAPCYDVFVIVSTYGGNTFTTFGATTD